MADRPIEMLKSDHRKVRELFTEYETTSVNDKEKKDEIAKEVCDDLEVHTAVEEKLFYPEIRDFSPKGAAMITDSIQEHQEIKDLISEMKRQTPGEAEYEAKFNQLVRIVEYHVENEEQKVFPFAEKNIEDKIGLGLAAKMLAEKSKLKAQQWI